MTPEKLKELQNHHDKDPIESIYSLAHLADARLFQGVRFLEKNGEYNIFVAFDYFKEVEEHLDEIKRLSKSLKGDKND